MQCRYVTTDWIMMPDWIMVSYILCYFVNNIIPAQHVIFDQ